MIVVRRVVLGVVTLALALVLVAPVSGLARVVPVPTAAAAGHVWDRWCSSSSSYVTWDQAHVVGTTTYLVPIRARQCVYGLVQGTDYMVLGSDVVSYQVGYDLGPYSACRSNPGAREFTPWTGAQIIYIRTFARYGCRNF